MANESDSGKQDLDSALSGDSQQVCTPGRPDRTTSSLHARQTHPPVDREQFIQKFLRILDIAKGKKRKIEKFLRDCVQDNTSQLDDAELDAVDGEAALAQACADLKSSFDAKAEEILTYIQNGLT